MLSTVQYVCLSNVIAKKLRITRDIPKYDMIAVHKNYILSPVNVL